MFLRAAAFLAGVASMGGSLYLLLADAIETGVWSLDHKMMPVYVVVTIFAGHFIGASIRARGWLGIPAALGYSLAFLLGTYLTVTASVNRQAMSSNDVHMQAEGKNERIADATRRLKRSRAMLEEAEAKALRCPEMTRDQCEKVKVTIQVYKDAVTGVNQELRDLGPPVTDRSVGQVVSATKLVGVSDDSLRALFLEIMSILSFGFAFAPFRARPTPTPNPPPNPPPNPMPSIKKPNHWAEVGPEVGPPNRPTPPDGRLRLVQGVGAQPPLPNPLPNPAQHKETHLLAQPLTNEETAQLAQLTMLASNGIVNATQEELAKHMQLKSRKEVRAVLRRFVAVRAILMETSVKGTVIRIVSRK